MANDAATIAELEAELAASRQREASLVVELSESREQQAATAEILRVIASSPSDLQSVLDAVAQRAMVLSRSRATKKHKQRKRNAGKLSQLVLFVPCCGNTVNEVKATTTRSPMCSLVALASGFGRVAMIDFVVFLSGVSVVR